MRVIDLLNKIANGEEVPKKIKRKSAIYTYNEGIDYKNNETGSYLMDSAICICCDDLNSIVEIIEEDKEIEEILDIELLGQCDNWLQKRDVNIKSDFELNPYILEAINRNFKSLYHKQCELIKSINELKKGK